jgi:UDP-glucuronate decarboxylase
MRGRGLSKPIFTEDMQFIAASDLNWGRLRKKTILVAGAAGFIPAYMVESILHLNDSNDLACKVIALVRNKERAEIRFAHHRNRPDLSFVVGDVAQPQCWPDHCDFIIHAASQASPKFYGTDPVGTMAPNLLGTYNLLDLARKWSVESFLFFSTGEVYGEVSADLVPTSEKDYGYIDITDLRSCYAESKRAAETLGVSFASQFGVPFKIVRPFHTYGPGMALDDGRVYADFVKNVVEGNNIVLHSDGTAVRAFCYLSDAVRGFFTVLFDGISGVAYNVGNPDGALSIRSLAELLAEISPIKGLKIESAERTKVGYMPSPISVNIPDVAKIRLLGWEPRIPPRDGFFRTIRFFSERHG